MEDKDRLLADDTSVEKTNQQLELPLSKFDAMQNIMQQMAQSMETMSQAWFHIAKKNDIQSDKGKQRGAKNTHADEPSTSRHKRPRPSETEGSSEDESDTCNSGSDSELDAEMLLKKSRVKEKVSEEVTKRDCAKSELMLEIEKEFETSDKGPEVENQVAKTVNKRWSEKMDIGILKVIQEKEIWTLQEGFSKRKKKSNIGTRKRTRNLAGR